MSGGILPEDQRRAALARTARDWMDIYIEVIERQLPSGPEVFEQWTKVNRPRLRKIGDRFTSAGLTLDERIEGIRTFRPPNDIHFLTPSNPYVTFHWPDGQSLTFRDTRAGSAMAFWVWWSNFQLPIIGPSEGKTRNIIAGSPEYRSYMEAKRRDQEKGIEPS